MSRQQGVYWNPTEPPMVDYGKGAYVYDKSGKQYIDGSGGPSVFCLGHGNEEVNEAIKGQLDRIAQGYRGNFTSEPLEQLQEIIARNCGNGLENSIVCCGGSEAVEACLKVALQYQSVIGQHSRRRFIARQRSWHGNTLGALSISGFAARRARFEGAVVDASFVSAANVYRPPVGVAPENIPEYCAAELEREILKQGPEHVAAFVFEPVVGAAGGAVPAPPGYAARMREVCDKYGVLLIADEVMCGVGRTGTWRALEHDGVVPDIMSIAKGLGGGYVPLGASVFQKRIADAIIETDGAIAVGHTFTGHTLACAAGVAVQNIIEREDLITRVRQEGDWLVNTLRSELGQNPHIGDVRGRGYFIGIEFVQDRDSKEPFAPEQMVFAKLQATAFENGLICYPVQGNVDGKKGDIAIVSPPYNANRAELEEIVDKFVRSADQVVKSVT